MIFSLDREYAVQDAIKAAKESERLQNLIKELEAENRTLSQAIQEKNVEYEQKKLRNKEYAPLIAEARKLDVILKEKINRVGEVTHRNQGHQKKINQHEMQLQAAINDISICNKEIDRLRAWQQDNDSRRPIAENITLIQSKLNDGSVLLKEISEEKTREKDLIEKLGKLLSEAEKMQDEIRDETGKIKKLTSAISEQQTMLAKTSIDELNANYSELANKRTLYLKAGNTWAKIWQAKNNSEKLAGKVNGLSAEIEQTTSALNEHRLILEKTKIERDYAARSFARAQLQVAENVERLRSQLTDGEECPVCGSLSHPFSGHHPHVDILIESLKKEASEKETIYESFLKEDARLNSFIKNSTTVLNGIITEKEMLDETVTNLMCDWHSLPLEKELFQIPENEVAAALVESEQKMETQINILQNKINAFYSGKKLLDAAITERDRFRVSFDLLTEKQNALTSEIRSIKESNQQIHLSICKSGTRLTDIINELKPFFSDDRWIDNWQANTAVFLKQLNGFAQNWKENEQKLTEQQHAVQHLTTMESSLGNQLCVLREEFSELQNELEACQREKQSIVKTRKNILSGESADKVEKRISGELELLQSKLNDSNQALHKLKTTLVAHQTNAENVARHLSELSKIQTENNNIIIKWAAAYNSKTKENLPAESLSELMKYDIAWIRNEQSFFEKLRMSLHEAGSLYNEKCRLVEQHLSENKPGQTQNELEQYHADLQSKSDTVRYRKNEIQVILNQHNERYNRYRDLLEKAEQQTIVVEKWSKLSELVGSSDGKKFRSLAQEFTLDVLLIHANHHLKFLSKRYILSRIPESLGLQVLDMDMGGETRTVYSLSGGESFLVSLALALGLASLSSDKMQVGSLFIDEGFGVLDPQTLDMVMDALDRLHQQGRKVGVISHVQEMKERITTRIQVEKMSNGKSMVTVVA